MKTATYRMYKPTRSVSGFTYAAAWKKAFQKLLDGLLVVVSGLGIATIIGFILLI